MSRKNPPAAPTFSSIDELVSSGLLTPNLFGEQGAKPAAAEPARKKEGATAGDLAKEFGASAIEGVGDIGQMIGEGAAYVANKVSGTEDYEGKNLLSPVSDGIRDTMTEGGKQARQDAQIKGDITDLSSIDGPDSLDGWLMLGASGFGSLATTLIPIAGPAARAMKLAKAAQAAKAAGDAARAAVLAKEAAAAAKAVTAIGATAGAATTGGAAARDVRATAAERVAQMTHEQLLQAPAYADVFRRTGDEQQARSAVVNDAARMSAGMAGAFGALGGAAGGAVLKSTLAREGVKALGGGAKTVAGRAAAGTALGAVGEGGQELTEKLGQNAGENLAFGEGLTDNVTRDTAGDVIAGAMVGGHVGGVSGLAARAPAPAAPLPVQQKAAEPNSPLSKAATAGVAASPAPAPEPAPAAPPADPILDRAREIQVAVRQGGLLEALRSAESPVDTKAFLNDLAAASSPSTAPQLREQAMTRLEFAMGWAEQAPTAPAAPTDDVSGMQPDARPDAPRPTMSQMQAAVDRDSELLAAAGAAPGARQAEQLLSEADRREQAAIDIESSPRARPADLARANELRMSAQALRARADGIQGVSHAPAPLSAFDAEQIEAQRQVNMQQRMRSPAVPAPAPAAPAPAPATPTDMARLEAAAMAGDERNRRAEDEPRRAVVDAALRRVESRGGVATPSEAAIFAEAGIGRPYDRIDESLEPAPAPAVPRMELRQPDGLVVEESYSRRDPDRLARLAGTVEPVGDFGESALTSSPGAAGPRVDGIDPDGMFDTGGLELQRSAARESSSPASEQTVAEETVSAPRGVAIRPGAAPAFIRRRRAQLDQLAAMGFETVERRPDGFVMRNSRTNQVLQLSGAADAQLARAAIAAAVDRGAHKAAASPLNDKLEPTSAQIEAGNYEKGRIANLNGVRISIENPRGSVRRGVGADGRAWETKMVHHYGDVEGSVGADGDPVDVFIGPRPDSTRIFVIDQRNADGTFDEHKVMMGFTDEASARAGYLANYEKGWTGLGAITEMTPEQFKAWVKSTSAKNEAASTAVGVVTVKDRGRDVTLGLVNVDRMPSKKRAQARLLQRLGRMFGKDVLFFSDPRGEIDSDGFVKDGDEDVLYLNEKSGINTLSVFGHELMHLLRRENPQAYAAVAKVVAARVKDPQGFVRYYGAEGMAGDAVLEELVADLNGDLMRDQSFWREVLDQLHDEHGDQAKSIIGRFAEFIYRWVSQVAKAFDGEKGFDSLRFIDDSKEVRDAFRQALASYMKQRGITRTAMQAEVMRAGEAVKKSSARKTKSEQEYDDVVAQYRETDKWLKAPDGSPTKLTERQWVQVRTPSFKAWFGDWEKFAGMQGGVWSDNKGEVSKVVGKNGEPLVVYHGTSSGGFSEFRGASGTNRGELGIFATDNWDMAATYARRGRRHDIDEGDLAQYERDEDPINGVYALFMNLRDPGEDNFEGANWDGQRNDQWMVEVGGEPQTDADGSMYFSRDEARELAKTFIAPEDEDTDPDDLLVAAANHWQTTEGAVREAINSSQDGAILRDVVDDGGGAAFYDGTPADIFVAFSPEQVKSADFNTGSFNALLEDIRRSKARQAAAPTVDDLTPVAERGRRAVGQRAQLSDAEKAAIKESADKVGVSEREIAATVREHKLAHPQAQGWAPLTFLRAKIDAGKVVYEYQKTPYSFHAGSDGKALKPDTPAYNRRVSAVAKAMADEVRRVHDRAEAGDQNAKNILAQAGWYKAMRGRLRHEFGGLGDLFADLLGATSPNTPVRDNWANAVDSLRRATRGDFDTLIPAWEAWASDVDEREAALRGWFNERLAEGMSKKDIKAMPEYQERASALGEARKLPDSLLPTKESGKKYGFNGRNVARAMVDLWRIVRDADPDVGRGGTAPKALNFSGNLIGFRERATIDVWAARMLQRLAGGRRIPSMAEDGVSGDMRSDGSTTLQFGFGQDVFSAAVKQIRSDETMGLHDTLSRINDDDLQAVVWFVEKELWTVNDWTSAAGEGGSFELEANLAGPADQAKIKELRRIADSRRSTPAARQQARRELVAMERSVDRYVGGLSVQMSAETQGRDYVPTDADMARLSSELRLAIYEDESSAAVVGSKTMSTEGRYGAPERSFDLEVVAREGYNPTSLWRKMLEMARDARQDSTFLSRVLRSDEAPDPLVHRPGVEIYFRETVPREQLDQALQELAREGVEFLTVIVDGRRMSDAVAGAMPSAVGVRVLYVPEFDQRYGGEDLLGLSDEELAAHMQRRRDEMHDMADRVASQVGNVSFAGAFWYETDVAFSHEYKEKIDAVATGAAEAGSEEAGGRWSGRPIRRGLASADRQAREAAGGEPGGDDAPVGGDAGGLRRSARRGGGREGRERAPLAGAPNVVGAAGPDTRLVEVAERYAAENGIELRRQARYVEVDEDRARRIAAAYEAMPHAPQDPRVKEAYENLVRQTVEQYRALEAAGYRFYFFDETNDPYEGNPWNAMRDLRANQVMGVFATEAGFGSGATDLNVDDNPLLADTGIVWPWGSLDGKPKRVLANDLFRAVHDAFGHGLEGAGFRAQGEENAWQAHVRLFTGSAVAAITSETRGQNSWLNYGPYGEKNRTARVEDTTFADQKTGLMPEWTWTEGVVEDEANDHADPAPERAIKSRRRDPQTMTPAFQSWFGNSAVVDADGRPLVMYTGTSKDVDFKAFKVPKNGVWFTSDPESASQYAKENDSKGLKYNADTGRYDEVNTSARVIPAYLRITKPYTLSDEERDRIYKATHYKAVQAQVFATVRARGYDGIDMGGGVWVVLNEPSQIKSAAGNGGGFDPTKGDITKSASRVFDQDKIEQYRFPDFKSREKLVEMRIADFLALSEDGRIEAKMADLRQSLGAGERLRELPFLQFSESGETARVDGHEGRHRARVLAEMGFDTMPVLLRSAAIRWSEQSDPDRFDYRETWPKRLVAQRRAADEGFSIPFPVSRADAMLPYDGDDEPTPPAGGPGGGRRANEITASRARSEVRVESSGKDWFEAKVGKRTVGKLAVWEDASGKFVVMNVFVDPRYRQRGVARAMYQAAEQANGRELVPAVSLSDDGFEFWKRYRPEAVANDLRHRPELIGRRARKGDFEGTITKASGGTATLTRDDGITKTLFRDELDSLLLPQGEAQMSRARDATDTPEFKRWFGDSKVVDEQGRPLVVYHGTRGDFSRFAVESVGRNYRDSVGGFFFTGSPRLASAYALTRGGDGGNVMPAYVSLKNPLTLGEYLWSISSNPKTELHDRGISLSDLFDESSAAVVEYARSEGRDGILWRNGSDTFVVAFRPEQIKSATGNAGSFDPESDDITKSAARVWSTPGQSSFDDLVYKMQDKHVDTKRVVEAVKEAGAALRDDQDVYLQEELFHGRAAARTEDFVRTELDPLIREMAELGISSAELDEFLHARHAQEANAVIAARNPQIQDGGSGMLNNDAVAYFAQLTPAKRQALERAAARVDGILRGTREMLVDYELVSAAQAQSWASMFKHYVPLMREDEGGHTGGGTGQGFSIKGKEVKSRTGSTRKVVDILANIAMQRERAIVRGEKNRVSKALVGLVEANPNRDFWVVDEVPAEQVFNPSTGQVETRQDNLFKQRDNVLVAKMVDNSGQVIERAVVFNEKDERAMRMAGALKNLDAAQLEGLLGVSAKVTRYFAAVNTQYNPVFGIVNLMRDVQGALVNLQSTELAGHGREVAKQTLSALRGIYADIRAERKGAPATSPWAQLWEEFQHVGGQTGFRQMFATSADRAAQIEATLNPDAWMDSRWGRVFTAGGALRVPMSQAMKGARIIFDWLSDYNESMENGVRLAAYKVALDQGMSKERAASLAKNLTVNFNRKGQVAQQAGAIYAFFNASMQGTARLGATLFDMEAGKPKTIRLSKLGQRIVYGGMLLGSMQALALAAAGFDDDDPPQFVRERALIIPTGWAGVGPDKGYVSIPMPLGLHVIPNLGRITTEWALSGFEDPARRATDVVALFADSFNPIGNAGLSMQTLAPTALDPLVALTENRDYAGRPIAKESSNKAVPGHALARDTSSAVGKLLSEGINYMSGGTRHTAGVLSPTPDQIDYLIGQVTGGVGRELSKVEQTAMSLARGEELPTHKIPLVGRLVGDSASQASEGNRFYANIDQLNKIETELKGLKGEGDVEGIRRVRMENPEAYLVTMANHAERQVQKLRKRKSELIKAGAPREEVIAIEQRITERMAALNRAVEKVRAG